jgi:hypothetical protein
VFVVEQKCPITCLYKFPDYLYKYHFCLFQFQSDATLARRRVVRRGKFAPADRFANTKKLVFHTIFTEKQKIKTHKQVCTCPSLKPIVREHICIPSDQKPMIKPRLANPGERCDLDLETKCTHNSMYDEKNIVLVENRYSRKENVLVRRQHSKNLFIYYSFKYISCISRRNQKNY